MTTLFHSARKLDADGQIDDFWMLIDGNLITQTGSGADRPPAETSIDVERKWLVPGFIDLHGHGGGGHSYDDGPEEIEAGLAIHRAHGTTRSVISLVTQPMAALRQSLSAIADLTASDPLVLGSHMEGPYLSRERRGAHDPTQLLEPTPSELGDLIDASRQTLCQVTIAPELPGAIEAIDTFIDAGVIVAIGHTEADFDLTRQAFDRGARILTHVFNAMPSIHHRAPGPVIAALNDARVTIEMILDGLHVHPDVAGMAFRSAPGRIALITDAMAAAGSGDGEYRLGSRNVTVRDQMAVLSGTTTLAGSTLTQDVALQCAIERVGVSPLEAITALTATPAKALGLDNRFGRLAPGLAADAVVLDAGWQVQQVWAEGVRIRP